MNFRFGFTLTILLAGLLLLAACGAVPSTALSPLPTFATERVASDRDACGCDATACAGADAAAYHADPTASRRPTSSQHCEFDG